MGGELVSVILRTVLQRFAQDHMDEHNQRFLTAEMEQLRPRAERLIQAEADRIESLQRAGGPVYASVALRATYQTGSVTGPDSSGDPGIETTVLVPVRLENVEIGREDINTSHEDIPGLGEPFLVGLAQQVGSAILGRQDHLITYSVELPDPQQILEATVSEIVDMYLYMVRESRGEGGDAAEFAQLVRQMQAEARTVIDLGDPHAARDLATAILDDGRIEPYQLEQIMEMLHW